MTMSPRAMSRSAQFEPMKPATPVTITILRPTCGAIEPSSSPSFDSTVERSESDVSSACTSS